MKRFMPSPRLLVLAAVLSAGAVRAQVRPVRLPAVSVGGAAAAAAAAPLGASGGLPVLPPALTGSAALPGAPNPILSREAGALNPGSVDLYPGPATPTDGMTYLLSRLGVKAVEQVLSEDASSQDWHYQIVTSGPEAAAALAQALSALHGAGTVKVHPEVFARLRRQPAMLLEARALVERLSAEGVRGLDSYYDGSSSESEPERLVFGAKEGAPAPMNGSILSPSAGAPTPARRPAAVPAPRKASQEEVDRIIAEHEARKAAEEARASKSWVIKAAVSAGAGLLAAIPVFLVVDALQPPGRSYRFSEPFGLASAAGLIVGGALRLLIWLGEAVGGDAPEAGERPRGSESQSGSAYTALLLAAGVLGALVAGALPFLAILLSRFNSTVFHSYALLLSAMGASYLGVKAALGWISRSRRIARREAELDLALEKSRGLLSGMSDDPAVFDDFFKDLRRRGREQIRLEEK